MSNTEFKLPTTDTKLKVKAYKQVRGKNKEIGKDHAASFAFGPAKKHIMADTSKGNPLTLEERKFFENSEKSGLAFNPGDLAVNHKDKDNYWNNPLNRVILDAAGTDLDISQPEDYLKWKYILSNTQLVAKNPEELDGSAKKKTFRWVIEPEGYQATVKSNKYNETQKIYRFLGKIDDDKVSMINFLMEAYPKKHIASSTTEEFLRGELNKLATEKPKLFITVMEDTDRNVKALIKKALKCNALTLDGVSYQLYTGDVLAESLVDMIKFLKDPENQEIVDKLEIKIEQSNV